MVERVVCILLGIVHLLLGIATFAGGKQRFPEPGYTALLSLTDGQVWPYGFMWALGGIIMLVAHRGFRLVGIGIIIGISNLWAALFAVSAFQSPSAPFTPIAAYGGYGLLNAVLFSLIVLHMRREDGMQ